MDSPPDQRPALLPDQSRGKNDKGREMGVGKVLDAGINLSLNFLLIFSKFSLKISKNF